MAVLGIELADYFEDLFSIHELEASANDRLDVIVQNNNTTHRVQRRGPFEANLYETYHSLNEPSECTLFHKSFKSTSPLMSH